MLDNFLKLEAKSFAKIVKADAGKYENLEALQERIDKELKAFNHQNKIKYLQFYQCELSELFKDHLNQCFDTDCPQYKTNNNSKFIVDQLINDLSSIETESLKMKNRSESETTIVQTFWKDPVFSKVIAAAIILFTTTVYSFLKAKFEDTAFKFQFNNLWHQKFDLWIIVLFILSIMLVRSIIKRILRKSLSSFKYDLETLQVDKNFYDKITKVFLTQEHMLPIKNHTFSSSPFEIKRIDFIFVLSEEKYKSDFEFLNPKLEKLKKDVIFEIEKLNTLIREFVFGTGNSGWLCIPSEWEYNQPERKQKAVKLLTEQENMLSYKYDTFIRVCRKTLKI